MSVDKLRKLRELWREDSELTATLEAQFDQIGFSEAYLAECLASAENGLATRKTKYIKDNVWGMVELDWHGVRLLDCPVLQRLRGVKQLGFSFLTYPTAEHSRFVHSLGMSAVVDSFLTSIDRRAGEPGASSSPDRCLRVDELDPVKRNDLIHAALLHDVGHLPFSHAAEFALAADPDVFLCGRKPVSQLRADVARCTKKEISLSEALSLLVVLSDRFERFYLKFVRPGEEDPSCLLRIACLIAGLPPNERLSGVAELISSGAIDADKIDYVNRDAEACGIPIGVDVARIFLRSSFLDVDRERMLAAGLKAEPAEREALFIVNASGIDTLDEITQARAALYQRVYLHPVTRTAEAMLARGLEANAHADPAESVPALRDALTIWSMADDELLSQLATAPSPRAKSYGRALKTRRLPKKACVFSASIAEMHMPLKRLIRGLDKSNADELRKLIVNTPLEKLDAKALGGSQARALEDRVLQETRRLGELLKGTEHAKLVPTTALDWVVVVGTSYMDKTRKECIVLQNGELLQTSEFTNVRETQDALEIFKAVGFVMAEPDWAPLVAIAARSVLAAPQRIMPASLTGRDQDTPSTPIKIQERMLLDLRGLYRRSGAKRESLEQVVLAATESGYFDDQPHLAPKVNPDAARVRALAERFASFDGERSWQVRTETIAAFLNQFPPRLRDDMQNGLEQLVFFDNAELSRSIRELLLGIGGPADVVGFTPNSGSAVMTALRRAARPDESLAAFRLDMELRQALDQDTKDPLILVDDNASSGVQSSAQLLAWAGVPRAEWPRECRDEDGIFDVALEPDRLERLRKRPFWICVCAGRNTALERIEWALNKAQILGFQGLRFKHEITQTYEWSEDLKVFLSSVGSSLLAWSRAQKELGELELDDRRFCEENAFGYGNAGGLLATATNVPTSTFTALWHPGIYRGAPWMPLMIRQHKLRHLVLG